jgi:hypothetical protein
MSAIFSFLVHLVVAVSALGALILFRRVNDWRLSPDPLFFVFCF